MKALTTLLLASWLMACLAGCSTIPADDVRALEGQNDGLKKEALARIGAVPSVLESLVNLFRSRGNERKAVALLIESLNARRSSEEMDAAMLKVLGELGKRNQVPPAALAARLADEKLGVRFRAAEALGKIKSQEAVPALIEALNDGENRNTVIWALGEIRDRRAVEPLNRLLGSPNRYEKYNAGRALSKIR